MMHVPEYEILADILHAWCVGACCCVIWICVLCEHYTTTPHHLPSGWHLGEHDMWCKMSCLELGTRVPLIFKAPWVTANTMTGVVSGALAELVDMYHLCQINIEIVLAKILK